MNLDEARGRLERLSRAYMPSPAMIEGEGEQSAIASIRRFIEQNADHGILAARGLEAILDELGAPDSGIVGVDDPVVMLLRDLCRKTLESIVSITPLGFYEASYFRMVDMFDMVEAYLESIEIMQELIARAHAS